MNLLNDIQKCFDKVVNEEELRESATKEALQILNELRYLFETKNAPKQKIKEKLNSLFAICNRFYK